MSEKNDKQTKVEVAKKASHGLRGTVAETIQSGATHFEHDDIQVLKFHGIYQQDDRDNRNDRRKEGLEPEYSFMVRVAIPGGALSGPQYLALDALADEFANGTLRVTTRQAIQFHGVMIGDLKSQIASINERLLSTIGACGDVQRNVMTCPAPIDDAAHLAVRALARELATNLRPETRAYHEIWLGEEKVVSTQQDESFYGEQYLPRKFKVAVALDTDNCVDVYSCDCGLIAVTRGDRIAGYQVLVGGGMGMTHEKASTFARLASSLGFVSPEHAVESVRLVAEIFRDHGNRSDRKHARLKYLIEDWGLDAFRAEFRKRAPFELAPPHDLAAPEYHDHLGPHAKPHQTGFYGMYIENGRIADRPGLPLRSTIRDVVRSTGANVSLTAQQNLLLTGLSKQSIADIESAFRQAGLTLPDDIAPARRHSMACPALPTCGLAITESERVMPRVLDDLVAVFKELGVSHEPMTIRMTGCPNGCARPYTADIAFVGRKPGERYNIYVGGALAGDRVADLYAADVPYAEFVDTLRPLLRAWSQTRRPAEGLSAFYHRVLGTATPRQKITGAEDPTNVLIPLEVLTR
ncbi:MAG: NADPH-dependent assimilatory sulfite reductase hemoprotein subunit [Phycisphaerales bacterium]|nr:NADPH-dependent assimilatory sulfite reductase hemoprotein subunit [Phycisphaerales bacterium]MCB9862416.1 NADPH-dependent assimilatory sulfite reductase hemoprotein subunit [Phycisphaerales bacterium]